MTIYQKQGVCTAHVAVTVNESRINTNNIHYTLKSFTYDTGVNKRAHGVTKYNHAAIQHPLRATKCSTAFKQAAGPS